MDYWNSREQELIKKHAEILKRRQELLDASIQEFVQTRHDVTDADHQNMLKTDQYWFAKKQRNEKLVSEINELVHQMKASHGRKEDTLAATKLKIQKEAYWNYVASCLPQWLRNLEQADQNSPRNPDN